MKRFFLYPLLGAACFLVGVGLSACGNSSSASGASSSLQNEVNTLKSEVATLKNEYTTMHAEVAKLTNLRLAVSGGSTTTNASVEGVSYATSSGTAPGQGWTATGYPTTSNSSTTNILGILSATGYSANISEASAGGYGYIQPPLAPMTPVFTSADCLGPIYLLSGDISSYNRGYNGLSLGAATSGFVFTLDPSQQFGMTLAEWSDPAYYWYVPAGESTTSITPVSYWNMGGGCNNKTYPTVNAYPVLQNDANVTSIPSAPRPGPVERSNP